MIIYRDIKCITHEEGTFRVCIQERGGGLYGFIHERYEPEYDGWVPHESSGYYDSAEAAERAARSDIAWLQAKAS